MFDFFILITAIVLIVIDAIYLNLMKGYFEKQIQIIQGSKPQIKYTGVLICYLFLVIGLYYFIIKPKKSVSDAFLFGLVVYAVYESTNYALFNKWSILTVVMDTLWGGILFALTTYIVNMLRNI
jgi:uncharacterized membrane protein